MVFKHQGQYERSSHIPTITHEGKEIARGDHWSRLIGEAVANIPASEHPVYIATGGGYGSWGKLIENLKTEGKIDVSIPSIKDEGFRNHPSYTAEREAVLAEIEAQTESARPEAAEQTRSAFYSDEFNTKLAKETVKAAIREGKSVIHESASIYADTLERAQLAHGHGVKTILIAGDRDHAGAIEEQKSSIEPQNTATSYRQFAKRFEGELVPAFDEVQLYNSDQTPPKLIAEKKGAGQALEIYDEALYAQFKARALLDPSKYATPTARDNILVAQNAQLFPLSKGRGDVAS